MTSKNPHRGHLSNLWLRVTWTHHPPAELPGFQVFSTLPSSHVGRDSSAPYQTPRYKDFSVTSSWQIGRIFCRRFSAEKKNRWCQHDGPNHGGQVGKMSNTRWFKVTFSSPSWRSLNLWKGHLDTPKRSQRIARQMHFANDLQKIW